MTSTLLQIIDKKLNDAGLLTDHGINLVDKCIFIDEGWPNYIKIREHDILIYTNFLDSTWQDIRCSGGRCTWCLPSNKIDSLYHGETTTISKADPELIPKILHSLA